MPDNLAQEFALTMPAIPTALHDVRSSLRTWLSHEEVPPLVQTDIVLAIDEAVANCVEHAIPASPPKPVDFSVVAFVRPHEFSVTVSDNGWWCDHPRDGNRGRGIALMVAVMTTVDIEKSAGGTTIHMRRQY